MAFTSAKYVGAAKGVPQVRLCFCTPPNRLRYVCYRRVVVVLVNQLWLCSMVHWFSTVKGTFLARTRLPLGVAAAFSCSPLSSSSSDCSSSGSPSPSCSAAAPHVVSSGDWTRPCPAIQSTTLVPSCSVKPSRRGFIRRFVACTELPFFRGIADPFSIVFVPMPH